MKSLIAEYKEFFTKPRLRSLYVGLFVLALALIFQYYATAYTALRVTNPVGDIFLDNLPIINLNPIIVEGALGAVVVSFFLVFSKPRYILFSIKALAVFIAIRSFFIALTHTGIYPGQIVPDKGFFDQLYLSLNMQTGYFFSAHTGLPFLMGLIFWENKFWRYAYLIASAIFGISVLLAHVHYSIDVFAAPFMAYGIFKMSQYLFYEDYRAIDPAHIRRM